MNFLEGRLESKGGAVRAKVGDVSLAIDAPGFEELEDARAVTVGVRPHDVALAAEGEGTPFDVALIEALGAESYAHGTFGGAPFVARLPRARRSRKAIARSWRSRTSILPSRARAKASARPSS